MSGEMTYTTVPGKLAVLMKKIRDAGIPDKASNDWLVTIGLKSSNDRTLLRVLKQIDFIGTDGKPTQRWREYRGADHKAVLAQALRDGYPKVFQTYADANARDNVELGHIFSSQSSAGKEVVDKMVSTFRTLADLADFGTAPSATPALAPAAASTSSPAAAVAAVASSSRAAGAVTVNVNIQLTLPETTDSKVFDAFFKSMKKHLLSEDDS